MILCFRESNTWVQNDAPIPDAGLDGELNATDEFIRDVSLEIDIGTVLWTLHGSRRTTHVHHDVSAAKSRDCREHLWIQSASRNVVDDMCTSVHGRFCDRSTVCIYRDGD